MHIGQRLKQRRKALSLTQTQLAREVNSSQQVIANIERGASKQSSLIPTICEHLGLNYEIMLSEISSTSIRFTEAHYRIMRESMEEALTVIVDYHRIHGGSFVVTPENIQQTTKAFINCCRSTVQAQLTKLDEQLTKQIEEGTLPNRLPKDIIDNGEASTHKEDLLNTEVKDSTNLTEQYLEETSTDAEVIEVEDDAEVTAEADADNSTTSDAKDTDIMLG